jgi:predicted thioesterase
VEDLMPDETNAPDPTGSASWVVSQTDLASELAEPGEAFPEVFATSRMIALMELAASRAMRNQLGPDELSVGVKVNVEHSAATPFGVTVRAEASFVGKEGMLYAFEVVASDEAGEIGRGTHHRAVVQTSRLLATAQKRRSSRTR